MKRHQLSQQHQLRALRQRVVLRMLRQLSQRLKQRHTRGGCAADPVASPLATRASALVSASAAAFVVFALASGCSTPERINYGAPCEDTSGCDAPYACVDGQCLFPCLDDVDCDDDAYCNGVERCVANQCVGGGPPCLSDNCNEGDDSCGACVAAHDCDDGAHCNGRETCEDGACVAGEAACAADSAQPACDEVIDQCVCTPSSCADDGEL